MRYIFFTIIVLSYNIIYSQATAVIRADSTTFIVDSVSGLFISDTSAICSRLYTDSGIASYYGRQFQGRRTSCGERFDMHLYTAAHKSLPFGTYVVVTNLSNYKSIIVKINDRMPAWNHREIDLSQAAAAYLDYIPKGITTVQIEIFKDN